MNNAEVAAFIINAVAEEIKDDEYYRGDSLKNTLNEVVTDLEGFGNKLNEINELTK